MASKNKKSRFRVSLFVNYVAFFITVEIIALVAFGWVMFYFLIGSWEDSQKQKLVENAANIADVCEEYRLDVNDSRLSDYSEISYSVSSLSDVLNAEILISDLKGHVLFCSDVANNKEQDETVCNEHVKMQLPGEIVIGVAADVIMATRSDMGGLFEDEKFVSASSVRDYTGKNVTAVVFVIQDWDSGLMSYETSFLKTYISSAIAFMIITTLIVYFSTNIVTRPLRDIFEATKKYSNGDFSFRIRRNRRSTVREFDSLAASINAMAESLEQTENSRAQFVANVSHELKTPMTTIGGFIDGILDGTISTSQQEHYLSIVSDEIKRLSNLVVSMLNMSKMQAGQMRINPERFNLTQQVINIFMSFEQAVDDKQLSIKGLDLLPNIYIEADNGMINQVFYNLIDNAVKFTPASGDISTAMDVADDFVTVIIKNTGAGIKQEDIDHIFERFFKVDKSRSLDTKSVGLGLFIVKSIVNLHGGQITVESIEGKYTQFAVKLKIKLIN